MSSAALFAIWPLALTANVFFPIGTIKAERLLYLPSVGRALGCGWLVAAAAVRHRTGTLLGFAALLAAFAVRTWVRNLDWRDNDTLFVRTVDDAPGSAKAHFNAGAAFDRARRWDDAMAHYRRALAILPRYAEAALGVGLVHWMRGADDAAALEWYEKALRLDPRRAEVHLRIGSLNKLRGECDAAEAAFLSGLELEPNDPRLLVNWSAVCLAQGDRWGALDALARLDRIGMVEEQERLTVNAAGKEIEAELR